MAADIDVYHEWLGIQEPQRPLNHYQLLRVKQFTDDTARIREHYRKMNAHVRKFATGEYARQSQQLLNELARAMLTLTDAQRKREYDASLGRKDTGEFRRRGLDEVLLGRKMIDQNQLARARQYADAVGLDLREAVVQQKMATPAAAAQAYAESEGLPYIELADIGVAKEVVPRIPPHLARQNNTVPVMVDDGTLLMASPYPLSPDVEQELRLRCGMPVRTVICTGASVHAAVGEHFPREAAAAEPAAATSAASAPPEAYVAPEEKLRRRAMVAVVGFNIGVVVVILALALLRGGVHLMGVGDFVLAVFVALLVAGATFATAMLGDR